jgi:rhamnulose-1-phosphate aldolase
MNLNFKEKMISNKGKQNSYLSDEKLLAELDKIAEVAGFLWQRNWAEANGGNISVNLTHLVNITNQEFPETANKTELAEALPEIAGNLFYVTGAGKRMRDVANSPLDFGALVRISRDGKQVEIVSENSVKPTSELPSHLNIHNFLLAKGNRKSVVLHTHPTELIALTHCPPFLDGKRLTQMLWSMIPETRVLVPKGVGIVPYVLTGTTAMAKATIKQLERHDVVLWEKHGALAVGDDILHCFDLLDTLTKSAKIYLAAKKAGFEPQGLSQEQMDELAGAFGLPTEI